MTILLNPGPVMLSNAIRQALTNPDICHRESEFITLQNTIRQALLDVYQLSQSAWAVILLTASGTAAIEAMLTSLVPKDGKLLIIENGVYGERMTKIACCHKIPHTTLHHEWQEAVDLDRLAKKLATEGNISQIALVHHETTTGRLNNINAIAELASNYNIPLLLDAVSSFGAESINFNDWHIAACASVANKCLHSAAGAAFVLVNRDALTTMVNPPARTLYLDLTTQLASQDNQHTLFTPGVPAYYALATALTELAKEGGQPARKQYYGMLMQQVRNGLLKLNIEPLLLAKESSCAVNAFRLPKGISYSTLHDRLKAAGFIIYAGQGGIAKSFFRVACMGELTHQDIDGFILATAEIIANDGRVK